MLVLVHHIVAIYLNCNGFLLHLIYSRKLGLTTKEEEKWGQEQQWYSPNKKLLLLKSVMIRIVVVKFLVFMPLVHRGCGLRSISAWLTNYASIPLWVCTYKLYRYLLVMLFSNKLWWCLISFGEEPQLQSSVKNCMQSLCGTCAEFVWSLWGVYAGLFADGTRIIDMGLKRIQDWKIHNWRDCYD